MAASMNPYLNYNGNAEEAFNFYKKVFGTEFKMVQRFKDVPGGDKVAAEDQNKIMHISLPIGNDNYLMASDSLESMGQQLKEGNNFYISLEADSKEEAKKLFDGLSSGGKIEMPLEDAFWGAYFGVFKDQFGIQWMISHTYPKN
jgi:PhnB protein